MNNINVIVDFINQDDIPFVEQAIFGSGEEMVDIGKYADAHHPAIRCLMADP